MEPEKYLKGKRVLIVDDEVDIYLADILDAREKNKNVFVRWYDRLRGFLDRRFGPDWKDKDAHFWDSLMKNSIG